MEPSSKVLGVRGAASLCSSSVLFSRPLTTTCRRLRPPLLLHLQQFPISGNLFQGLSCSLQQQQRTSWITQLRRPGGDGERIGREIHHGAWKRPRAAEEVTQFSSSVRCSQAASSEAAAHSNGDGGEEEDAEARDLAALEEFVHINTGSWSGTFTQYDVLGNRLQCIPTKVTAHSYGKGSNISLLQTLKVKQAGSKTTVTDEDDSEPVWEEFKLDETNLLTFDRRQQVGFFPGEKAYTVSHQTAEMLDKVLRVGVLGEDNDEQEEFPKGVKLPSRRPALVCESCLYSQDANSRVRAFHVLDPRGFLDVIGVFHESKDNSTFDESQTEPVDEASKRIHALLGTWSGRLVTRRTGIYGATIVQSNVQVVFEKEESGKFLQEIISSSGAGTKIRLQGTSTGAVLRFEGGLLTTLLPGGKALTCPGSVGRSVGRAQSFNFEFSWIESPGQRRRLVRTYDVDGVVVSTSLAIEAKV